jgi:hypothetical protein
MTAKPRKPSSWFHALLRIEPGRCTDRLLTTSQCDTAMDLATGTAMALAGLFAGTCALIAIVDRSVPGWLWWVVGIALYVAAEIALQGPRKVERKARAALRRAKQ